MGALANKTHTLASNVIDSGSFTTAYPAGSSQATLNGSVGGQLVIQQAVIEQGAGGFTVVFGVSDITITNDSDWTWPAGEELILSFGKSDVNGSYNPIDNRVDWDDIVDKPTAFPAPVAELTASGAVPAGTRILELSHATVAIAATIADFADFPGLFIVRNTSSTGTEAHTLTLSAGTFDGTNDVATLNAPGEALTVFVDADGRGQVIENTGSVGLS